MELIKGRPVNSSNRLTKEIRVYDLLDKLNIEYQRVDHEAAMTMEACVEIDRVLNASTCKNLLLCNRQKTNFYLLLMPGDKVFQTKETAIVSSSLTPNSPSRYIPGSTVITMPSSTVVSSRRENPGVS